MDRPRSPGAAGGLAPGLTKQVKPVSTSGGGVGEEGDAGYRGGNRQDPGKGSAWNGVFSPACFSHDNYTHAQV